jgi:hypothetical protein
MLLDQNLNEFHLLGSVGREESSTTCISFSLIQLAGIIQVV